MNAFAESLAQLHLLRPFWLAALPCISVIWWLVRDRGRTEQGWRTHIAPHLLEALTINSANTARLRPVDLVAVVLLCLSLAAAGPTWRTAPNPFLSETAPLVIAIEISDSMLANDLKPNRLERAKLKLLDLITSRPGARHALIAYAGSAHLVLPLTEDPEVLKPFLESLDPKIMPRSGQDAAAALKLAGEILESDETPGSLLLVTDGIDPEDVSAFAAYNAADHPHHVVALILATDEQGAVRRLEQEGGVSIIEATPEDTDIRLVEHQLLSNLRATLEASKETLWEDQGWLLLWPAAILTLLWFRRGWTMPWVWLLVLVGNMSTPGNARAESFADLWFTPDQQGRYAYEHKRYVEAAELFEDPQWKAIAAYRSGRYQEAAEIYAQVPTAEAAFSQGTALVKARAYNDALAAFHRALDREPDHEGAQQNLAVTKAIIAYLDRLRMAEDTGEQNELGADDFAFDDTSGEGKEIVITGDSALKLDSAEQWMRSVDSGPQDFLKTRFALEAAKAGEE